MARPERRDGDGERQGRQSSLLRVDHEHVEGSHEEIRAEATDGAPAEKYFVASQPMTVSSGGETRPTLKSILECVDEAGDSPWEVPHEGNRGQKVTLAALFIVQFYNDELQLPHRRRRESISRRRES